MSKSSSPVVLVVEDSPSFANRICSVLHDSYEFNTEVAKSYKEAAEILQNPEKKYICAIVDVTLTDAPNGEAIDLTIERDIPTLVFTGTQCETTRDDFWAKGIADYVCKEGSYGLDYVAWMTNRLYHNPDVKVLVVDDSQIAIETTQFILGIHRYKVLTANSGEQALVMLKEHPDIKICLMDCYMDGINGMEAATKMRASHNRDELEIIGLSAGGQQISAQFIKAGANDFLLKPFLPEELLCRVNHAAESHEAYQKLKDLNNLKNQMLGTAAHDIRGPIAAIKTAMELINRGTISEQQKQSLLTMIYNNSIDSLELLESLLDVSAIESGNIDLNINDTDISNLVKERVEIYEMQANNKSITIKQTIEDGINKAVDRVKIKEVVDNLITNAIKFSPLESEIDIFLKQQENQIKLIVSDSGPGIPEEEKEQLFVPFSTLSSKSTNGEKQTGLGLAIVKNIVEAHAGNIFYNTNDRGGASFSVEIPSA